MIKQLKEALIAAGWELGFNDKEYLSAYNGTLSLRAYKGGMYSEVMVHHRAKQLLSVSDTEGGDINLTEVLEYIKLTSGL